MILADKNLDLQQEQDARKMRTLFRQLFQLCFTEVEIEETESTNSGRVEVTASIPIALTGFVNSLRSLRSGLLGGVVYVSRLIYSGSSSNTIIGRCHPTSLTGRQFMVTGS